MEEKTLEKIEESGEEVIETMPNSIGEILIYAGGCAAIATAVGVAIHFISKKIIKKDEEKTLEKDDHDVEPMELEDDFDGDTIIEKE